MPNLGTIAKYLSLFSIGKGFVDKIVLQKMMAGGIAIISAAVVVAILVGSLIIAALGGIYYALVSTTQITHWGAALIVASLVIILIVFLVYKITEGVKKIAAASAILTQSAANPASPVVDIVTAFLDGLKNKPAPPASKARVYPRAAR